MPELNCILLLLNIPFQNHLFLNVVEKSAQTRGTPVDFGDLQIFDSKPLHTPFRLFFSVSFSKAFIVYFTFQPRQNKRRNPPRGRTTGSGVIFAICDGTGKNQITKISERSWWAHLDSNQGPTGYEPVALTN